MGTKSKRCGDRHSFREHGIGAGLTRKICSQCGVVQIGEGRRSVLATDLKLQKSLPIFMQAS